MEGVDEIMIDKDVVEGRKEPIRVFAKKVKEAPGAA
jgi:ATP-dependent Clp protease ATP-binding subunit ClpX